MKRRMGCQSTSFVIIHIYIFVYSSAKLLSIKAFFKNISYDYPTKFIVLTHTDRQTRIAVGNFCTLIYRQTAVALYEQLNTDNKKVLDIAIYGENTQLTADDSVNIFANVSVHTTEKQT